MLERFGVTFDWRGATIDAVSNISKLADVSGFGYLWIPEAWGLEAFSTIGYLFGVTRNIKIGAGVVNVYSRSAATIAMASATLDQIAPRRFLLGLGTSGKRLVEGWHGMSFANSLERTTAYVEIIRMILKGEEARYDGESFKLSRFRLYSTPPQTDIEIHVGAMGEKNLALASKIADGAIVTLYPISKLGQCAESINQSSSNEKKLFAYLPLRIVETDSERQEARAELSKYLAFYIASMGIYYAQNLSRLGFEREVEQILLARREKKETPFPISDELFDELCLVGSKGEILERVSKLPKGVYPVFGLDPKSPRQANWLVELAETETSS